MNLTQPEIIQILRRRRELNQGTLGSRAFNTSFESGRTKIKNIELGRQQPTSSDLKKMAAVLEVPVSALIPAGSSQDQSTAPGQSAEGEVCLFAPVLAMFPGLAPYLEMLNKAVTLDDEELIDHISEKIAQLFRQRIKASLAPNRALAPSKG